MPKRKLSSPNLGSPKAPIPFGSGKWGYRRNGQWLYRSPETVGKFVKVTDLALILELEKRGYKVLYPPHECIDRPHLPCPACEMDSTKRAIKIA
jgi:hypothetical protein